MRKLLPIAVTGIAAAMIFAASAQAQQTPSTKASQTPNTQSNKPSLSRPGQTETTKPGASPLTTQKEKASYAIGLNIGRSMRKDSVDVDPKILLRGMTDGLSGGETFMTDEEAKAAMVALQSELREKHEAKMELEAEANKKAGDAFLAENKTKDGIVTLPSGLQYKVLVAGTGPKPAATDTVVCNYKGMLLDNTEFDSSYKHGKPVTIPVTGIIKGWTEALQLMPVGSKWQLFVPPDLAYGNRGGAGGAIGPNSTLVFEVELMSIQPKPESQAPSPAAKPAPTPDNK